MATVALFPCNQRAQIRLHIGTKRLKVALLFLIAVLLFPYPTEVGARTLDGARFALHRKPHLSSKTVNLCPTFQQESYDPNFDNLPCSQYTVTDLTNVFPGPDIYVMLGGGGSAGFKGASFGIEYEPAPGQGVDVINWIPCADGLLLPSSGQYGDFPSSQGGLRVTWTACQEKVIGDDGVHAVVGVLSVYAYGEDILKITPNNNLQSGPELSVADCQSFETNFLDIHSPSTVPLLMGAVHFGGDGSQGFTPCGVSIVGVEPPVSPPVTRIHGSFPSPFTSSTSLRFDLAEPGPVRVDVFDIRGRLLKTLLDRSQASPQEFSVPWNGRDADGHPASSGMYFLRIRAGAVSFTQRVVLIR